MEIITGKKDSLEQVIKLSRVPAHYRTVDENNFFKQFLTRFSFFRNQVGERVLDNVLLLATKYLKYRKIEAGDFIYHINQPSDQVYFILSGEAWKLRPLTELELDREKLLKQKKSKEAPKILQAITLAKAFNDRNRASFLTNKNIGAPSSPSRRKSPRGSNDQIKFFKQDERPDSIKMDFKESSPTTSPKSKKSNFGSIKEGLLKKIKVTKDVLNFENDYFSGLIKRDQELSAKYIKDKMVTMRFERKVEQYETIGEVAMSLTQLRMTSLFAYTDVHLFYLDHKSYEKVFYAQLEEIQEKLSFFKDYFRDISFETFKRMCFLFTEKRFKLGEIVYREEDHSDNLYFIKTGEVQLLKKIKVEKEDDQNEPPKEMTLKSNFAQKPLKQVTIGRVYEGLFFGEEVLSGKQPRRFTAKSVSNLLCYVVRSNILHRLPPKVIEKLRDISISKQNWTGDRIEVLKKQPLFQKMKKTIEISIPRNDVPEESKYFLKSSSINTLGTLGTLSRSQTPRTNYVVSPNKTRDSTENQFSEYGFKTNTSSSFNFLLGTTEKQQDGETLRSYEPSTYRNEAKRKLLTRERDNLKVRSRRGLRSIFQNAAKELAKSSSRSKSPRSIVSVAESRQKKTRDFGSLKTILKPKRPKEGAGSVNSVTLENNNTTSTIEDDGNFTYNFLTKNTVKTVESIQEEQKPCNTSIEVKKNLNHLVVKQVLRNNQQLRKAGSPTSRVLTESQVTSKTNQTDKFKCVINSIVQNENMVVYPTQGSQFLRNLSIRAYSPSHVIFKESLKSFLDNKYNSPKNEAASSMYGLKLDTSVQPPQEGTVIEKKKPKLINIREKKIIKEEN